MVAYSFKSRFIDPIRKGLGQPEKISVVKFMYVNPKRQTIRADRKRHARPGEEIQLYCGMRTRHCFLIGRARCTDVSDIVITFGQASAVAVGSAGKRVAAFAGAGLDEFAGRDGFADWSEMREFWTREHGRIERFVGVLIEWEPL